MKIILFGAPGAGKGTQAEVFSKRLGIPTISTGNILREAVMSRTKIGLQAKEYMDSGRLVPDDIIMGVMKKRLAAEDCKNGYILDGVPRTIEQARSLEKFGIEFDFVISIEVSDEAIEARLTGRRVCPVCEATYHITGNPPQKEGICDGCGGKLILRKDDAPETVKARLKIFHEITEPLKDFYENQGKLKRIICDGSVEEVSRLIAEAIGLKQ